MSKKIKAVLLFNAELFYTHSWFENKRRNTQNHEVNKQNWFIWETLLSKKWQKIQKHTNGVFRLKDGIHFKTNCQTFKPKKISDQSYRKIPKNQTNTMWSKTTNQSINVPKKKDVQGGIQGVKPWHTQTYHFCRDMFAETSCFSFMKWITSLKQWNV